MNQTLRYGRKNKDELPLIGLYSCLFCEQCFGTKLQLKQHYYENHRESISDFRGKIAVFH